MQAKVIMIKIIMIITSMDRTINQEVKTLTTIIKMIITAGIIIIIREMIIKKITIQVIIMAIKLKVSAT